VLLDESASVAGARAGQLEVLNGEGEVGVIGVVHKEPVTQKTFMAINRIFEIFDNGALLRENKIIPIACR
jgi:hypothetical protein